MQGDSGGSDWNRFCVFLRESGKQSDALTFDALSEIAVTADQTLQGTQQPPTYCTRRCGTSDYVSATPLTTSKAPQIRTNKPQECHAETDNSIWLRRCRTSRLRVTERERSLDFINIASMRKNLFFAARLAAAQNNPQAVSSETLLRYLQDLLYSSYSSDPSTHMND